MITAPVNEPRVAPLGLPRRDAPHDDAIRSVVEFIVCVTCIILLATTWLVEPFIVPSGSMATTLLGPHRRIVCHECGFAYDVGSDESDRRSRACCPNCEATTDAVLEQLVAQGDRLLVAKQAFRIRDPERFEVAVFRRPGQAGQAYVKRIAGLPGESVLIRDGDLFINGQRVRKTLAQQRALSSLVHDARHTSPAVPPAWRPSSGESCWRDQGEGRFQAAGEAAPSKPNSARRPIHWLDYEHLVRPLAPTAPIQSGPIVDRVAYNQVQRMQLVDDFDETHDLLLKAKLAASGEGAIYFRANAGADQFFASIRPDDRSVELYHNGRLVVEGTLPETIDGPEPKLIEWSVVDAQTILAVEGRVCFPPYQWTPSNESASPVESPLAIGAQGPAVDVHELQVWRDVYYTNPYRRSGRPRGAVGWGVDEPCQLGPDEYFMLGDNSRYSEDSRLWPEGAGVPRAALIGKAFVVHYPSRWIEWGERRFPVPDWERIRYIR